MRKDIIRDFKVPLANMPNFYTLTKHRPKITSLLVKPSVLHNDLILDSEVVNIDATELTSTNDLVPRPTRNVEGSSVKLLSSFIGNTQISLQDAFFNVEEHRRAEGINAGQISGTYDEYLMLMAKKHKDRYNITMEGNIIILDIYDGAQHQKRQQEKRTRIVSFSSQMISSSTLEAGATPEQSFNILTWIQMEGG